MQEQRQLYFTQLKDIIVTVEDNPEAITSITLPEIPLETFTHIVKLFVNMNIKYSILLFDIYKIYNEQYASIVKQNIDKKLEQLMLELFILSNMDDNTDYVSTSHILPEPHIFIFKYILDNHINKYSNLKKIYGIMFTTHKQAQLLPYLKMLMKYTDKIGVGKKKSKRRNNSQNKSRKKTGEKGRRERQERKKKKKVIESPKKTLRKTKKKVNQK